MDGMILSLYNAMESEHVQRTHHNVDAKFTNCEVCSWLQNVVRIMKEEEDAAIAAHLAEQKEGIA